MDKAKAKELANQITSSGKAVGFPANLKVYTGGKAPGVDKWIVYAHDFNVGGDLPDAWQYLATPEEVVDFLAELS